MSSKNKRTPQRGRRNRKRKRTALVICQNESQFWTTQAQFWQWVRELKVTKIKDNPLTGELHPEHEESLVVLGNNVLNMVHRNHINEVLNSRRYMKKR